MRFLQKSRDAKRGRVGVVDLPILAVVLLWAFPVLAADPDATESDTARSAEGDGFRVQSRGTEDYRGTQEEVKFSITDDLATKLLQFDEWTVDGESQTAAQQAASGEQGGAVRDGASSAANPSSGSHPAEGQGTAAVGQQAAGDSRTPGAGSDPTAAELNSGSHPANTGPFDPNAVGTSARPGAQQQPTLPIRPDRRAKEDDVAQMIREAAEQETDPARRQELIDQYKAYVDSL